MTFPASQSNFTSSTFESPFRILFVAFPRFVPFTSCFVGLTATTMAAALGAADGHQFSVKVLLAACLGLVFFMLTRFFFRLRSEFAASQSAGAFFAFNLFGAVATAAFGVATALQPFFFGFTDGACAPIFFACATAFGFAFLVFFSFAFFAFSFCVRRFPFALTPRVERIEAAENEEAATSPSC